MTTTDPTSHPTCPRCGTTLAADAPEGLCPRCLAAVNFGDATLFTGDEASLPPPPVEELAPHFPQLEILSCLGRGGMGVVYKARQISLDRLVALKLLAPEREKDPEFSERFAREAHALARMSHPNIVTVHDFGQAGGFFYLLMEFVDGANLRQLLQAHKFTPEQALGVVPPLCDALQYAHDRGIVHRDIKPENLLMDREGKLKVADFGLAKMLGNDFAADERPMGTPNYMAPEQAGDPAKVDNRADIYSLGVVIYEMLTGQLPGRNFHPPSATAGVDARLDEVVHRAMEHEPAQRYQRASILKTEVEKITQAPPDVPPPATPGVPSPVGPGEPDSRPPSIRSKKIRLVAGVILALLLLGVGTPMVLKRVNAARERDKLARMLAYMDEFRATQKQPATPTSPEELKTRYEATSQIKDHMVRCCALGTLARDAAASGNVSTTWQALVGINECRMHDETSRTVALQLTDLGLRNDAMKIASEVQEVSMRDRVLAEVSVRKSPARTERESPDSPDNRQK